MKSSHWILKPLSYAMLSGTSSHCEKKFMVCGTSGFHTGRGVFTRAWVKQRVRPATAEPCVPSTWNVTRSSRRTRTHHDEFMCATMPPSSWKVA